MQRARTDARPHRRPAVMADVGRLAGVSHQTVSRVINGSERVRPETRERVLDAMRQLDYRPNSLARALVTGRTRTLGVVTFDTVLFGPASTLFGIERAAHLAGYFVSVASLTSLDRASVLGGVERLQSQGVDGILIIAPQDRTAGALVNLPVDVPVVAVEAGPDDAMPVVAVDQLAGAAAATRHLLELGHRTVWHLAGPEDWKEARARIAGWRSALDATGAAVPPVLTGDWSARSGYELAEGLLTKAGVTAIFAANDQMALGVLRRAHELDIELPGDLSVVGFDDIPEAAYFTPSLTTVRQDFGEVGRRSLMTLVALIEGEDAPPPPATTVAPELVVRSSTTVAATQRGLTL